MMTVTKVMNNAIKSMDLEKVCAAAFVCPFGPLFACFKFDVLVCRDRGQITKTMDQFEKNFEELDIQSSVMENSIQQSTGAVMPEDQVDNLMKQVSLSLSLSLSLYSRAASNPETTPLPSPRPPQ